MMHDAAPFVRRIRIRNYKSIAECDVSLGSFTIIVGRNGSGKSNFLDALRFVADGLQTSLDHAMKARGGITEVRRRSTGHPNSFRIQLEIQLPEDSTADYSIEVTARKDRGFAVKHESLNVRFVNGSHVGFRVEEGTVTPINLGRAGSGGLLSAGGYILPPASIERLYLVTVSGFPEFRPVYDALSAIGFYNLNPQAIRELQSPDPGELLRRDGSNLASVVGRLAERNPDLKSRIHQFLNAIVADILDFERVTLGPSETLQFSQAVKGSSSPWRFYASNMSDGTLRALGVLVAVMQLTGDGQPLRLAGIEEPETALHPAASGALIDALREGAEHTQVVVTSHSPDLLDRFDSETDSLLVAQASQGTTEIGLPNDLATEAIQRHLCTPGELLRQDQLLPKGSGAQLLMPTSEAVGR